MVQSAQPGRVRLTRPALGVVSIDRMTTIEHDPVRRPARRPPPRLGLHRVLGRQRPGHRRVPDVRASASAARPTPGPRPGVRDKASYVLEQGDIRFVVSGALDADSPIAEHVRKHGDGVHDLAWLVDDATAAYEAAVARGARSVPRPVDRDRRRRARWSWPRSAPTARPSTRSSAAPATRGRRPRARLRRPTTCRPTPVGPEVGLTRIDHVVGNVEKGKLDDWVRFYAEVLGFGQLVHFDDNQIATEYSALDVDGGVGRLQDRHADQRAGRRPQEEPDPGVPRAPTTVPACSTSRCAPTTSWPRCRRCATAACAS